MVLVITCWAGKHRTCALHTAPRSYLSVCCSDNPDLAPEAKAKGWLFHIIDIPDPVFREEAGVPTHSHTNEVFLGNLRSKYVKFFQIRHDPFIASLLKDHDTVIYIDQKRRLVDSHVLNLLEIHEKGARPLTAMSNPGVSVEREFISARKQPRYRQISNVIKKYLHLKTQKGYSRSAPVHYTGLLIFDPKCEDVLSLFDQVFSEVYGWGIIECQVVWGIVEQDFPGLVHSSLWSTVGVPMHVRPKPYVPPLYLALPAPI